DNAALLQAIAEHPALLERPVLVTPTRAAIGRPLENIAALLG
ncbi:MAG: ArsC/Spx/MgsR family protein, partial [Neisseria mucosa]|nr:ArsC/Spx/MgsR family protein [Neisseria mucosa]